MHYMLNEFHKLFLVVVVVTSSLVAPLEFKRVVVLLSGALDHLTTRDPPHLGLEYTRVDVFLRTSL